MSRDEKNGKNLIKGYDLVNFHPSLAISRMKLREERENFFKVDMWHSATFNHKNSIRVQYRFLLEMKKEILIEIQWKGFTSTNERQDLGNVW